MNTQITERIHRITGLVETKNPGSAAEMIQEDKEIGSVFLEVLKPEIDKKISWKVTGQNIDRKRDLVCQKQFPNRFCGFFKTSCFSIFC